MNRFKIVLRMTNGGFPAPHTPISPPPYSLHAPNNPDQPTTSKLTMPSRPSPSSAASSKQNPGGVTQLPSLDPKRSNSAEKAQQSPQGPAPTDRRTEPQGRHGSMGDTATKHSGVASGSLTRRDVTASQPTAPRGADKIELQTFETPKSPVGVPSRGSLEQQQSLAAKSFTPLGATHPQPSSGPIRGPNTPQPPNDQRPEPQSTPKPAPPSQSSPPPAVPSKQNSGAGILQPSLADPKISNPAGKTQQPPKGPVSTDQQTKKPSLDEAVAKVPIGESSLASGLFENWELSPSTSTALREPSTLVRPPEKIGLQTSQTPKSSSGATSVPSRGSQEQQQPSAPKSLASPGVTHAQVSSGPTKTPNTPPPPNNQRPEQSATPKPAPLSHTSPPPAVSSKQNPSAGIQPPPPPDPKLSNLAGRLQQSSQGPVPTGQRTDKPRLDESPGKASMSPSAPVSGSLENREVTTSSSIPPREPFSLVRTSEKIGLQTSQTPKASLDATSVPSRGSQASQQPLVPKSLATPKVPHPQDSSGHSKTPEKKTTSTLGSSLPVVGGSSTPVPASTTPGPPPVRPSYTSYGIP